MLTACRSRCVHLCRYGYAQTVTHLKIRHQHTGDSQTKCPYQTLGIKRTASPEEIRKAYLDKVRIYHPDANQNDETLQKKFVDVGEAYKSLTNPSYTPNAAHSGSRHSKYYNEWREYENPTKSSEPPGSSTGTKETYYFYSYIKWILALKVIFWFFFIDPLGLLEDEDDWIPDPNEAAVFYVPSRRKSERSEKLSPDQPKKPTRVKPEGP